MATALKPPGAILGSKVVDYLLLGERDGEPLAYIGEGEDSDRIRSHDGSKDWWNLAVLVTASANNLNKAHVKYLEARLVEEARSVGKVALENGTTPARAHAVGHQELQDGCGSVGRSGS